MSVPSATQATNQLARRMPGWAELADLLLVLGLALLSPALLLFPAMLRVPLGVAVVLFAPGYALQAALFPRDLFDAPTRLGLSIGLSVAQASLLALLLNALPWGMTPPAISVALALDMALFAFVGIARRWLVRPHADPVLPSFNRAVLLRRLLVVGSAGAAVAALVALLLLVATPKPTLMTEFYALGQAGRAESYPTLADSGATIQLPLGITSHEAVAIQYRVVLRSGTNTLQALGPFTLEPGATWRETATFRLTQPGQQLVDVLLFADPQSEPYRWLQLPITIRGTP